MLVIVTAIGAAVSFAVSQICVRRGLGHASPTTAVSISIITMTTIVLLTFGPQVSMDHFSYQGVLLFTDLGTFSPKAPNEK